MRVISASHDGASRAMRRPQISSSQKSVKTPRRRRAMPRSRIATTALRNLRTSQQRPAHAVRAELPRRHAEALAELLSEVVLRSEPAAPRDLRDAQVPALEQPRRLLQPLLLQEVAEQSSGDAVEAAGDVLTRIAELFRHCLRSEERRGGRE